MSERREEQGIARPERVITVVITLDEDEICDPEVLVEIIRRHYYCSSVAVYEEGERVN